jgi:CheY-like chemotaxis protein
VSGVHGAVVDPSPPPEQPTRRDTLPMPSGDVGEGIAHALNNPLAALIANLDFATSVLNDETRDLRERLVDALELVTEARSAAERVRGVVRYLRAAGAVGPERKVRVLVVDDDAMVGRTLQRGLQGYDVVLLDNAKSALALLLRGEKFDVILCDLMMPEMTGMDLHEEVVRLVPGQAERMIFVTGGAVTKRARDFVALMGDRVFDKPFDVRALKDMVETRLPVI